jgi:hypothetical protein
MRLSNGEDRGDRGLRPGRKGSPDLEESALGLRLPGIGKATVRSSLEVMCSYHFAVAASCCYLRAHCLAQSAVPASA